MSSQFWENKKVFITGHTGFKGSWLCLWLSMLGAKVVGYALKPPTSPSLYELCKIDELIDSNIADIRNLPNLKKVIASTSPEIVFHMAAQPLVRESYKVPVDTYSTNVMGTVNLLEAARNCKGVKAIINITTDKCYENIEKTKGYKENEPLGGHDPYSSSKACSEIVTSAYRRSYGLNAATARAGNVVGGGDWAHDRLIPDFVRAILKGEKLLVRNPKAVRPWQHVLEPLAGYLLLAEKLYKYGSKYAEAWNFGPEKKDAKPVEWIVRQLCGKWGDGACFEIDKRKHPHEAGYLFLDCSKSKKKLGFKPKWNLEQAIDKIIEWTKVYNKKSSLRVVGLVSSSTTKSLRDVCLRQIKEYMANG